MCELLHPSKSQQRYKSINKILQGKPFFLLPGTDPERDQGYPVSLPDFTWDMIEAVARRPGIELTEAPVLQDPSLSPPFSCLFLIFFGDLDPLSNYIIWKGTLQRGVWNRKKDEFHKLRS